MMEKKNLEIKDSTVITDSTVSKSLNNTNVVKKSKIIKHKDESVNVGDHGRNVKINGGRNREILQNAGDVKNSWHKRPVGKVFLSLIAAIIAGLILFYGFGVH